MQQHSQHVFNVNAPCFDPEKYVKVDKNNSFNDINESHENASKKNLSENCFQYLNDQINLISNELEEDQHAKEVNTHVSDKAQTESEQNFLIQDFQKDNTSLLENKIKNTDKSLQFFNSSNSIKFFEQVDSIEINENSNKQNNKTGFEDYDEKNLKQSNCIDFFDEKDAIETINKELQLNSKLATPDSRPHLNVVFIGHVDAGKSTTCGNILVLTGEVDKRTVEKYEKEAKEKNRESWFYAYIFDTHEEERQKGKTVEVGRASFELEKLRFTILDAPGHKCFIPNMISGAAQADVAVLIISARKGEYETGFERGGQTREHAMLARTLGVTHLIVAVNKMDESTCDWNESRYLDIQKKVLPFLKSCGYNPEKNISFVPISGLSGANLKYHISDPTFGHVPQAQWYTKDKPTLLEILDNLEQPERDESAPLRIPLLEGFRDQGILATGKVETGTVFSGQNAILKPRNLKVKVQGVAINETFVTHAKTGENVTLKLYGVSEEQITKGSVLCSVEDSCPCVKSIKAQLIIVDLLEHRPIITAGYSCVMHAHTASEECQITALIESLDRSNKKKKKNPQFVRGNSVVVCNIQSLTGICLETFDQRKQMGRFTLRDEGKTIAVGKVLEILDNL